MGALPSLVRPAERRAGAPLQWERDGLDWPNRAASRFVSAAGLRWHVQQLGRGPTLLLLHGTGSATHSWRALAPALAASFEVLAPDLPGHGFTEAASGDGRTLPGVASALGALLRALGRRRPALVVGHSAGAAIAARMCLDGRIAPRGLVSLNGALLPLGGFASPAFAPIARLLTWNPLVPWLLSRRAADPAVVERLIRGTGSRLEPAGVRAYERLVRNPAHVAATLSMMAHWDLRPLARDLPDLKPAVLLVVGERDRYIAPSEAARVRALLPQARVARLAGLGHLAHEERPRRVAGLIVRFARSLGVA